MCCPKSQIRRGQNSIPSVHQDAEGFMVPVMDFFWARTCVGPGPVYLILPLGVALYLAADLAFLSSSVKCFFCFVVVIKNGRNQRCRVQNL